MPAHFSTLLNSGQLIPHTEKHYGGKKGMYMQTKGGFI